MSTGRGISIGSGGGVKLIPSTATFVAADLDINGDLLIDISALGATGVQSVSVTDENGNSQNYTFHLDGTNLTLYLAALGFSGTWTYVISYWI